MKLQKLGGIAIIVSIFVWIAAVLIYNRFGIPSDPVKAMEAYSTSPVYTNTCLLLISVCYLLLMIFFLALHERMHTDAPYLTCIMLIAISAAAAVGIMDTVVWKTGLDVIVPTRDVSAYRAINAILTGLYNAGYHATMWATLFAGWAILKSRAFSPILGWLSIAASILAILKFIIPQLGLVYPFYIAYVAIIWMGIETLRKRPNIDNQ
jgi:hypothetical protein